MSSLMEFFHACERLKNESRQTYKSNGTHETVAEHSWRLCLMVMVLSETVESIDRDKCIRMALIHDLPEVYAGDAYRLDVKAQAGRHATEQGALESLLRLVPEAAAEEIASLWLEFEEGKTREARLVRLVDRLEVLVQHNESEVHQWNDVERQIQYGLAGKHSERYGFLSDFASEIDQETKKKLGDAGYHTGLLDQDTYDKYYGT